MELTLKNRKTPGQIAVIITLFIAVIILLSVVIINIGKVSDAKVNSSQISDRGALSLCSQLGMYVGLLNNKVDQRTQLPQWLTGGNCAPNWGLILISIAVIAGAIAAPGVGGAAVMAALVVSGVYMQLADINAIQARAFSDAAYLMSSYTGFRESAIQSMLTSIQTDSQAVKKTAEYTLTDDSTGQQYVFDKDNPGWWAIDQALKNNKRVGRFNAWYWSKRFPEVSEAGKLTPLINDFIKAITDNTKIEEWDPDKWQIKKISLKVDAATTASERKWIIKDGVVRVVGPVALNDWLAESMPNWFKDFVYLDEGGFLIADLGFKGLTQRILNTVCFDETCSEDNPAITYAERTIIKIPGWEWFGIIDTQYNYEQLYQVNDDIYGFLTRSMELLNIPVSYRVTGITNWLPVFYDLKSAHAADDRQDMYGRLLWDIQKIDEWIQQLSAIDETIVPLIPEKNGDCATGAGSVTNDCEPDLECDDTSCWCVNSNDCAWEGIYCSCSPGIYSELCGHGDLYGNKPSPCPPSHSFRCECGCGNDASTDDQINRACRFQGDLNWAPAKNSETEVRQAIEILTNLNTALRAIVEAMKEVGEATRLILASSPLKEEAVYGWVDEYNKYHLVRAKVAGYPAYENFPSISENDQELYGLLKCWTIQGQTAGEVKTAVSSYTSDVPTGWWDVKVRKNPAADEFGKDKLGAIITEIHGNTGGQVVSCKADLDDLLANYAISSATTGHYGAAKEEIYIKKAVP
jgi:hypothetical protein